MSSPPRRGAQPPLSQMTSTTLASIRTSSRLRWRAEPSTFQRQNHDQVKARDSHTNTPPLEAAGPLLRPPQISRGKVASNGNQPEQSTNQGMATGSNTCFKTLASDSVLCESFMHLHLLKPISTKGLQPDALKQGFQPKFYDGSQYGYLTKFVIDLSKSLFCPINILCTLDCSTGAK